MSKHKHYDVIVAWAEGKDIEIYNFYNEAWHICYDPIWDTTLHYRIKPEPKPDVVLYMNYFNWGGVTQWTSLDDAKKETDRSNLAGRLKLTFDGETGKLKSAEVLDV
jgi:hypothetical protein